ncbi:hypothetical protein E6O75_ATG10652 [Venturia nashicola]|uniref:Secreted protein n=1 Tax=Venturia nashicola TaxID=86259 RepID=A0A4Z1PAT5_9PEZI|nr:hypothetical protein E6O75_ATG10652 [Venturia nashicola]
MLLLNTLLLALAVFIASSSALAITISEGSEDADTGRGGYNSFPSRQLAVPILDQRGRQTARPRPRPYHDMQMATEASWNSRHGGKSNSGRYRQHYDLGPISEQIGITAKCSSHVSCSQQQLEPNIQPPSVPLTLIQCFLLSLHDFPLVKAGEVLMPMPSLDSAISVSHILATTRPYHPSCVPPDSIYYRHDPIQQKEPKLFTGEPLVESVHCRRESRDPVAVWKIFHKLIVLFRFKETSVHIASLANEKAADLQHPIYLTMPSRWSREQATSNLPWGSQNPVRLQPRETV